MESALLAFEQQTQATQAGQKALQQAIDELRSSELQKPQCCCCSSLMAGAHLSSRLAGLKGLQDLAPPAELEHHSAAVPKLEQRARRASERLHAIQVRVRVWTALDPLQSAQGMGLQTNSGLS